MDKKTISRWLNYNKFYIGKRLFNNIFKKLGKKYIKGLILDVGAGLSPFEKYIINGKFITLEYTIKDKPIVVGSAMNLPFKIETFDSIICTEVLEHLEEPGDCVKEIKRVLKKGGHLYLTAPMIWCLHYEPRDFYRFTNHGLVYLLSKENFKIVEVKPIGGIFSFIGMRLCEKFFNIVNKSIFFLPKNWRFIFVIPITFPVSFIIYNIVSILDKMGKRDVFSWCVIAVKE